VRRAASLTGALPAVVTKSTPLDAHSTADHNRVAAAPLANAWPHRATRIATAGPLVAFSEQRDDGCRDSWYGLAGRRRCRRRHRLGLPLAAAQAVKGVWSPSLPGGLVAVIVSIHTGLRHPLWPCWKFAVAMGAVSVLDEVVHPPGELPRFEVAVEP
jgi:hypothetical protein